MKNGYILDLEMADNDAGAKTIGDYFVKLLQELWDEGEGFSGKRPFGNSGWEYELYETLAKHGVIGECFDEEFDELYYNTNKGRDLITDLLSNLKIKSD